MLIQATQKYTRQTARKMRLVANQVKKKSLIDAIEQLGLIERRSSLTVLKVVRQAIANAMNNHGIALSDLTLKNIVVTEGPTYKRFQPVSRGRAHSIMKRTCHITVQLETGAAKETEKLETKKKEVIVAEKSAPAKAVKPAKTAKVSTKKTKKEA